LKACIQPSKDPYFPREGSLILFHCHNKKLSSGERAALNISGEPGETVAGLLEDDSKNICHGDAGTLNYPLRETPTQPGYASLLLNTALGYPPAQELTQRANPAGQHDQPRSVTNTFFIVQVPLFPVISMMTNRVLKPSSYNKTMTEIKSFESDGESQNNYL